MNQGWRDWSDWSACSTTCKTDESETRHRTRTCNGNKNWCTGESSETEHCSSLPSVVDGGWSDWSDWGVCSHMCGGGSQGAYRTCTNPIPQYNGTDCLGEPIKRQSCGKEACPFKIDVMTNCEDYSNWSECTVTCGGGTQMRYRNTTGPEDRCLATHTRLCNNHTCPITSQCDIANKRKNRCGDWSIKRAACEALGCCYGAISGLVGWPACFLPAPDHYTPNLLANPSFEDIYYRDGSMKPLTIGWTTRGPAYVTTEVSHLGYYSLRIASQSLSGGYGLQTIIIGQTGSFCLDISGWTLSRNSLIGRPKEYAVVVDMESEEGYKQMETIAINSDSRSQWKFFHHIVHPRYLVHTARLTLTYVGKQGVVYYDDIKVQEVMCNKSTSFPPNDISDYYPITILDRLPIDGGYSVWSDWSICDGGCGFNKAITIRTRSCTDPQPMGGGNPCVGPNIDTAQCTVLASSGMWSEWSPWSSCSGDCGLLRSSKSRIRFCNFRNNSRIGVGCYGDSEQIIQCTSTFCQSCNCTDWIQETNCNCSTYLAHYTRQCLPTPPRTLRHLTDPNQCSVLLDMYQIGMGHCDRAVEIYYEPINQLLRVQDYCLTLLSPLQDNGHPVKLLPCETGLIDQEWDWLDNTWHPHDNTNLCLTSCPTGQSCGPGQPIMAYPCDYSLKQDWVMAEIAEPIETQCDTYPVHKMHQCVGICMTTPSSSAASSLVNITIYQTEFNQKYFIDRISNLFVGEIKVIKVDYLEDNIITVSLAAPSANQGLSRNLAHPILTSLNIVFLRYSSEYCGTLPGCKKFAICDTDHGSACIKCYPGFTLSTSALCIPDHPAGQLKSNLSSMDSTTSTSKVVTIGASVGIGASAIGVIAIGCYWYYRRSQIRSSRELLVRDGWRPDSLIAFQQI
eukprot:Ihof_evm1s958 gene=Ihof_evmTU1s958